MQGLKYSFTLFTFQFGTFYIDGKLHILESSEPGLHTISIPNVNTDFIYDSISGMSKVNVH